MTVITRLIVTVALLPVLVPVFTAVAVYTFVAGVVDFVLTGKVGVEKSPGADAT